MASRYYPLTPNFRGLGAFLRGEEMQAHLHGRAEKIKAAAEADAPIGPPSDQHRGQYAASFEVESGVTENFEGHRVAYAKVTNSAPHAIDVELGGGGRAKAPKTSAHHTLERAIDAARE